MFKSLALIVLLLNCFVLTLTRINNDLIQTQIYEIYTHAVKLDGSLQNKKPFDPNRIEFYLYTRNSTDGIKFNYNDIALFKNKNVGIAYIIHGWITSKNATWYKPLRNAFLKLKEEFYLIEIDWSVYADDDYILASNYTQQIGITIGEHITKVYYKNGISLNNFVIVGHSLGAQIAGYMGQTVKSKTKKLLGRIVGLDPAGPLFNLRTPKERLSSDDAKVVEVIHTNGGTFGYLLPCGTIDFFPNGGKYQPGCPENLDLTNITSSDLFTCSHSRAHEYYTEGLGHDNKFVGTIVGVILPFNTVTLHVAMGDLFSQATGNYYLTTNSRAPYSR